MSDSIKPDPRLRDILDVPTVAKMLGITVDGLRKQINLGKLPALMLGNGGPRSTYVLHRVTVERFQKERLERLAKLPETHVSKR